MILSNRGAWSLLQRVACSFLRATDKAAEGIKVDAVSVDHRVKNGGAR